MPGPIGPHIDIHPLTSGHVEACASLMGRLDLFVKYGHSPERARSLIARALEEKRGDLVVAVRSGIVAGFAWLVPRGAFDRSGYLRLIAIDPASHGQGIGRALMAHLETRHLAAGGIVLLVSSANGPAQAFYERLGYSRVGHLPGYIGPGLDEYIYFKAPPP